MTTTNHSPARGAPERMPACRTDADVAPGAGRTHNPVPPSSTLGSAIRSSSSFTHARRRAAPLLAGVALILGCQSNEQRVDPVAERIDRVEQTQAAMRNSIEALTVSVGDVTTELAAVKVTVTKNSTRTVTNDVWPWVVMAGLVLATYLIQGSIRKHSYAVQKPLYEAGLPPDIRRIPL